MPACFRCQWRAGGSQVWHRTLLAVAAARCAAWSPQVRSADLRTKTLRPRAGGADRAAGAESAPVVSWPGPGHGPCPGRAPLGRCRVCRGPLRLPWHGFTAARGRACTFLPRSLPRWRCGGREMRHHLIPRPRSEPRTCNQHVVRHGRTIAKRPNSGFRNTFDTRPRGTSRAAAVPPVRQPCAWGPAEPGTSPSARLHPGTLPPLSGGSTAPPGRRRTHLRAVGCCGCCCGPDRACGRPRRRGLCGWRRARSRAPVGR